MTARSGRIYPFVLAAAGLFGADIPPPQVPENLKPPAGEAVLLKASGRGKQIYACQAVPGNAARFDWVLEKPQAELLDARGKRIGRHYEGPTWEASDGSKVVGEVQQRAPAPHAGAVPWLLLKAKTTQGAGIFGRVTYIQRVGTVGGAAPAEGCDSSHTGREVAIDYQAEYYFYGPRR
jgi:Protein of unknown function (DUF3455)